MLERDVTGAALALVPVIEPAVPVAATSPRVTGVGAVAGVADAGPIVVAGTVGTAAVGTDAVGTAAVGTDVVTVDVVTVDVVTSDVVTGGVATVGAGTSTVGVGGAVAVGAACAVGAVAVESEPVTVVEGSAALGGRLTAAGCVALALGDAAGPARPPVPIGVPALDGVLVPARELAAPGLDGLDGKEETVAAELPVTVAPPERELTAVTTTLAKALTAGRPVPVGAVPVPDVATAACAGPPAVDGVLGPGPCGPLALGFVAVGFVAVVEGAALIVTGVGAPRAEPSVAIGTVLAEPVVTPASPADGPAQA